MIEKRCKYCNKIIVDNWLEYLKKYNTEKEIQCPYCKGVEKIR